MSKTKLPRKVREDFYETPAYTTKAILPTVMARHKGQTILDPFAGNGAILATILSEYPFVPVDGIELNEARAEACRKRGIQCIHGNTLSIAAHGIEQLVVTNPPYSIALEAVKAGIALAGGGPAFFLMPFSFRSPKPRRAELFREKRPNVHLLADRPSFCKSVTCTSNACDWAIRISPLDKAPRRCGECGSDTRASSSDATEYAWFEFGPFADGRVFDLEATKPKRARS